MLLHIRSLAGYTIVMLESSFWKRQLLSSLSIAVSFALIELGLVFSDASYGLSGSCPSGRTFTWNAA